MRGLPQQRLQHLGQVSACIPSLRWLLYVGKSLPSGGFISLCTLVRREVQSQEQMPKAMKTQLFRPFIPSHHFFFYVVKTKPGRSGLYCIRYNNFDHDYPIISGLYVFFLWSNMRQVWTDRPAGRQRIVRCRGYFWHPFTCIYIFDIQCTRSA